MVVLPVSGIDVTLRSPGGEEDVLVREAPRRDMALTVRLLARLVEPGETAVCCETLTVTDIEALLLELRRNLFGDVVRGSARCSAAGCGAAVDVSFRITDYLAHHLPRRAREADPAEEEGWYSLRNAPVTFRLPIAADQIAVAGKREAERALIARCVRPPELPYRLLGRVSRAMEALAPPLADVVEGLCAACGMPMSAFFDPQEFTLRELYDGAALVFEDIHLLASRYHWSEDWIMRLPAARRTQYADLIREEEAGS
jgi:hypothetical protein